MHSPARHFSLPPPDNVRELPLGAQLDDAMLVTRAREGDKWAEEALYHRHVKYIMGMVIRLLGRIDEAEDVVQDTFVIGLNRLHTIRQPEMVRAWFAQIAVNEVRRRLRRVRLLSRLGFHASADQVDLESLATHDADGETRAELAAVSRVLGELPTNDRVAWMLRYVEGEPLEEVATLCACSLATAKRRILAATKRLQNHVEPVEEEVP
jgi:RNA polymerase sigma-70 factor (ECF subfamily)